jgi:hypothetical protein
MAATIESSAEIDPAALAPAAFVTGMLLVVTAAAGALAAAPRRSPNRIIVAGAAAVVTGSAVALRAFDTEPPTVLYVAAGCALLAGVGAVVCPWRPGMAVAAVTMVVGQPVLVLAVALATIRWPLGPAFTRLAGNPAVNAADTDFLTAPVGVLSGLVLGVLLAAISRVGRTANAAPGAAPAAPPGSTPQPAPV